MAREIVRARDRRAFEQRGLQTGITLSSRKWPLVQFDQWPGPRRIATSKPSSASSGAFDVDSFSSTFGTSRWNRDRRGNSHFIAKVGAR
ncbi:hypothetical protein C7S15_0017 [Burkholderia cepacia]|nr:hypothetical protein [Burkholderia cepacia]